MNLLKRMLATCGLSALAAAGLVAAPAQAQDYPTRNITMIVPFAAGGPTDVIARIVTGHMQTLGQSIIIENVVGAGGTTASARAAKAAPDGYTLITGHMGTHAASVPLYPKLAYHPSKDFEPCRSDRRHADPDPSAQGFSGEGSQGIRGLSEGQHRQAQ